MVVDACYNKSYGLPLDHIGPGTFVRTYIDLCRPEFAVADLERSACSGCMSAVHSCRNGYGLADYVMPLLVCCDRPDRTRIVSIRPASRDRDCEREKHGDSKN